MPWFRLEDSFDTHPKVIAAGNEATGLFVRCGTYCARHLTDGYIPEQVVLLYGSNELAETLVQAKLWRRVRGGWRMPDYLEYNPSAQTVDKERAAKNDRQKRWRDARSRRAVDASTRASRDASTEASLRRSRDASPPRPEGSGAGEPAPKAGSRRANPAGSPLPVAQAIAAALNPELNGRNEAL